MCIGLPETKATIDKKMYHQGHNNVVSSREAFPPERHLLLQQWGSIPDESGLVLSTDAKPRLKWTPELHDKFIEAVNQLGGADKATPKAVMRLMGIPGLTLYHLKSHLQVQRHLQFRIEAQGKYLQSVLEKAKETLGKQNLGAPGLEAAKVQLCELISEVSNECFSNAFPGLEIITRLNNNLQVHQAELADSRSSVESCLTSSEGSQKNQDINDLHQGLRKYNGSLLLRRPNLHDYKPFSSSSLGDYERASVSVCKFEAHPLSSKAQRGGAISEAWHKERRAEAIFLEHPHSKKHAEQKNRGKESTGFGIASHTAQLDLNADEDNGDGTERKFDLNGFSWA
ncbi:hypothetical protein ZIOFF_057854 [Zingiber officinale]|uniref:HTH myb-type domain-containing protein n=1 Tax=Zingiber officinale TaxID=94328 RepID=A0A8J5F849_ZINOF|nr:hypothetical protein ZIOFF_057854 [Zingiber officinale]